MFPNGLAFSVDFSKLYLSVSSPEEPAWYVYDLDDDGHLTNRRRLLDAKSMRKVKLTLTLTLTRVLLHPLAQNIFLLQSLVCCIPHNDTVYSTDLV